MNTSLYLNSLFTNKNISVHQNIDDLNKSNYLSQNNLILLKYNTNENLLFYSIANNIHQLSYNIYENNGLYVNSKNFVELNIDKYSIKEINNKLYYNINTIPYSTNSFNGILYIDNNYITNNILIDNKIINQLNTYNNILTYYLSNLNTIKNYVIYYNNLKNKVNAYSSNITFSDIFFKENILKFEQTLDNTKNAKKSYIDYNYYENSYTRYTKFSINKEIHPYKIDLEYISYLSLNNIKLQYRNNYYFNNGLLDMKYKDDMWEDIYPNDIIYYKNLSDLEFKIYLNTYNSNKYQDNVNYELNKKFINEKNIYLYLNSSYIKSSISKTYQNNTDEYTTYIIVNPYKSNNTSTYFNKSKIYDTNIIANVQKFSYNYQIELADIENQEYDISTEYIIYQKNITVHYNTESSNKLYLTYDMSPEYSYINIINIPIIYTYFMIYNSSEDLSNVIINDNLFNLLTTKGNIIYNNNLSKYLFYTYNYIYDNKIKKYFKDYHCLINKNITPLQYPTLSTDILNLDYIINIDILLNNFNNIQYNTINTTISTYICSINNKQITNPVKIRL